ncbi:LysR family transcriptional regulator [Burkholderia sp. RF2-non_BP3]|uniref:LysR family transcriptional regulator n=1 Tax=Burkholderia sp. RF2-non_BP3 TaxID=1637844 RepID=UPI00075A5E4B|nr:LysR family transcriptional regulator [Burkholderia sp. RF2-non_BP3]KUY61142.1 LysR family transcriptional regulator [Burkholderia sp. RF2-non_BP3]
MDQLNTSQRGFRVGSPNHADSLSNCFSANYVSIVVFMAVATEGSFSKAAERLGVGRSTVSRKVQRLEKQLSTRLFLRTTRTTRLTREGERFFENCNLGVTYIVGAVNEILDLRHGSPRGLLRVSATSGFGRNVVAPLLSKFSEIYPDISVELLLDDKPVDFAAGQIDVAFRDGHLEDSSIIAKRLIPMQMIVCASRAYAERRGLPSVPDELAQHDCINMRFSTGRVLEWEFAMDGQIRRYLPTSKLTFNDADLIRQAVLDGRGIAQLPAHQIWGYIRRGELVMLLTQHALKDRSHYICYLCREHLPARVRVFVDFMTEQIRALDLNDLDRFEAGEVGNAVAMLPA